MGSFDVTCSLTGIPIFPGDECVLVVLKDRFDFRRDSLSVDWKDDVERVVKSIYYDYGRPHPKEDASEEYLEELTEWEKKRLYFYLCREAWDYCLKHYPTTPGEIDRYAECRKDVDGLPDGYSDFIARIYPMPQQWQAEVASVLAAFQWACRNPLAGFNTTFQHDNKLLLEVAKLAEFTKDTANAKYKKRQAEYGYSEED